MKEIILKIIDENTYDIEAQCGTRYDAINIETDELAELLTKALDNLTSSSLIIHRRELLESFCHFLDSKGMDSIYTENDDLINEYLDSNSG